MQSAVVLRGAPRFNDQYIPPAINKPIVTMLNAAKVVVFACEADPGVGEMSVIARLARLWWRGLG